MIIHDNLNEIFFKFLIHHLVLITLKVGDYFYRIPKSLYLKIKTDLPY